MTEGGKKLLDDCFLHDKDRLKHETALSILSANLATVCETETVGLQEASGRILAEPVKATRNIPSTDNAAVDGYAYNSDDYDKTGGFFPVVTRIAAGETAAVQLPQGSAARIFTGAVMPGGADTIAMQEDCEPHQQDGTQFVIIPPGLKKGANRRKRSEDTADGDIIALTGARIDPPLVAALAATGLAEVGVFKPLRVAVLSSGEELREPGMQADPGQVFDSNRYLLNALLGYLPVTVTDLGILPDDYEAIAGAISKAAASHDVIITSGGASRGEEDHIVSALDQLGKRHMWQLAIKPGRPMTFGQIDDTVVFGLPGNPVACFVCFLLYVRPSLMRLGGGKWQEPRRYPLPSGFEIANKKPDRREFWRGMVRNGDDGTLYLEKFARDGSGLISGLREADGLIEINEETTSVSKQQILSFIPWTEFGI